MWPDKMGAMVLWNLRLFSFLSVSLFFRLSPAFLSIQASKCFRYEVIFMFPHVKLMFLDLKHVFLGLKLMFPDVKQHF